jgi:hypothetical protein
VIQKWEQQDTISAPRLLQIAIALGAALPELAAACRVLLRTVGLEARWTDHGPDDFR